MKIARVKGTRDLLPAETLRFAAAEETARRVFGAYGYGEIRTPELEPTELFTRSVGEATDIVHKEMYTFTDRGGRSLTLRPENTAGVVRAVVENRLDQAPMPLRLWYAGPQFRYERPQKGRYREFRQIGAELFGAPGPAADAEILVMLFDFLGALGFRDLSVSLNAVPVGEGRERFSAALREFAGARAELFGAPGPAADAEILVMLFDFLGALGFRDLSVSLNAVPVGEGRERFSAALREFAGARAERLGEDDRRRLAENPLRLFDSKDPETAAMLEGAPRAIDFLDPEARRHHEAVMELLRAAGIPFVEEPKLVRGLDYYTKTVFEVTSSRLGAQDAILGGGRYDDLVADLGGPPLAAVGFAIGEDRLVEVMPLAAAPAAGRVRVIPLAAEQEGYALAVARRLRSDAPVECDLSGRGVKKGLAAAAELGFEEAAIVGPDEARDGTVTMKNLKTREQRTVALGEVSR